MKMMDIIRCEDLRSLHRLTAKNTIPASEFVSFTNACLSGKLPAIQCRNLCRFLPTSTDIREELFGIDALKPSKIAKLAGKIDRADRLHCVLFWIEAFSKWWAFHFRLSDIEAVGEPHYHVRHIHLTCNLSQPMKTMRWVLDEIGKDRPNLPHDLHVPIEGYLFDDIRMG